LLITDAVSVVTIHGGDTVVQQAPLDWKIGKIIYNYIAGVLAGHLLGYFMKFTEPT
jgi:NhaP-type Na+/H+ or K+/H+ antiporter